MRTMRFIVLLTGPRWVDTGPVSPEAQRLRLSAARDVSEYSETGDDITSSTLWINGERDRSTKQHEPIDQRIGAILFVRMRIQPWRMNGDKFPE
ncbi:MAG: hypothetical protein OXG24_00550 [Gammaproteobacteria bacterium]|nr:hypothetical protein [Gammaproteobacteria bacterium]